MGPEQQARSRMHLSYQYRLYPKQGQLALLQTFLRELTYLWNYALEERVGSSSKAGGRVSYFTQQGQLKNWRKYDVAGLGLVPYCVARDCLQRLDLAIRASNGHMKKGTRRGPPRFRRSTRSFTFVPDDNPWRSGPNLTHAVKVPRIGAVPVRRHRVPPADGVVKAVTVHVEDSAWFATFQYQVPDPTPAAPNAPNAPVGVDLGVVHLAALSTGELVEMPRVYGHARLRLRREQRRLARKRPGSHRYERQRDRVARMHARLRRKRRWYAHQVSRDWAERFDLVAMEDLAIPTMLHQRGVAKSILDAGWGILRRFVAYKQILRSHRSILVPPAGTSQTCSRCGHIAVPRLRRDERVFRCPCGHTADRDVNAAQNVLRRGLAEVRRIAAELKRVDGTPPPAQTGRRAYQRNRELKSRRPGKESPTPSVWPQGQPDS